MYDTQSLQNFLENRLTRESTPADEYLYSNLAYKLLGYSIERIK